MKHSEFFNLNIPEQYDDYDVDAFDENFTIIDTELEKLTQAYSTLGSLGMGYGIVTEVENNIAICPISSYVRVPGGIIVVKFEEALGAEGQIQVGSYGPLPIYFGNVPLPEGVIVPGVTLCLACDGTSYRTLEPPTTSSMFPYPVP